jgi:hypothetical protein
MRLQRLALRSAFALVLVLTGATAAACGSAPRASGPSTGGATFRNSFLAFGHPAAWKPSVFKVTGRLHFAPMLYLSSQPLQQPCRKKGLDVVCGWPVDRLEPGAMLMVWENRGFPGWSLRTIPGTSMRVGGRKAKRTVSWPGECAAIGGDETIAVEIERPVPDNWTAFTACLKGPGLATTEGEIGAVLASTRFAAP